MFRSVNNIFNVGKASAFALTVRSKGYGFPLSNKNIPFHIPGAFISSCRILLKESSGEGEELFAVCSRCC